MSDWSLAIHTSSSLILSWFLSSSRTNGNGVWSILARLFEVDVPRLVSQYFWVKFGYWLTKFSGVFCEAWFFLRNDISFNQQNPADRVADILKVSICSRYVLLMIRFAFVLNHHHLIRFPFCLVSKKSFVQFFLHYRKHYFPMPCWSCSTFLFLYHLFTFHPVSYLLSIYFKFIRKLIDIFPIIIVIMNGFNFKLPCKRFSWWLRNHWEGIRRRLWNTCYMLCLWSYNP